MDALNNDVRGRPDDVGANSRHAAESSSGHGGTSLVTSRFAWIVWSTDVVLIVLWCVLAALGLFSAASIIGTIGIACTSLVPPTIGALILSRRPGNAIGWILYGMGIATAATWCSRAYVEEHRYQPASARPPLSWEWVAWVGDWLWLPPAFAMLTLALLLFPDGHVPSNRWRPLAWLAVILIVGLTVDAAVARSKLEYIVYPDPAPNPAYIEAVADFFNSTPTRAAAYVLGPLVVIGAVAAQVVRLRRARGVERQQLKWFAYLGSLVVLITAGSAIAGGAAPETPSHPWINEAFWYTFMAGPTVGMPLAIGIAIFRYQLYDVDFVINRTLVYLSLTAVLGLIYVGSVLLAQVVTHPLTQGSDLSVAAATLAVAALFRPARRQVQGVVDRRFYRSKYDAAQTLNAFATAARDEVDLDRLTGALVAVVSETMQPTHVGLWVRDDAASDQTATARTLAIAPNDPLVSFFQSHPHVAEVAKLQVVSPARAEMRAGGVQVAVPLVSQGELIGLLALGPRRSMQAYSADDRHLLDNLAAQAAPSVRVAQLVQQQRDEERAREAIEQEMRIAHLIQQSLLPRELPRMPGWHIGAHYQPARAVGGDFYDVIELPDNQVGIVVGDASDKGVPAALIMATTRTMLRAAAQRVFSPAEVLGQANESLCQESPQSIFVTCLYAILDPASGRLRYANAGHSPPYLLTSRDVVELRATGWPLGLMPETTYDEQETTIGPGDAVLLYSDGLIEAHNPRREMFGTPRLVDLLQSRPAAANLIDLLLTEMRRFTGPSYELEDDTTLLIVQRSMRHGGADSAPKRSPAERAGSDDAGGRRRMLAEFSVASEPGNERLVVARVVDAIRDVDFPAARLERLKTAVAEATMNAIEHGNHNQPELPVSIQVLASDADLAVRVTDQGGGQTIPDPPVPNLEAKLAGLQSPRGWGLFLIKNMVDEMHTTRTETSHTTELVLNRNGSDGGSRPA